MKKSIARFMSLMLFCFAFVLNAPAQNIQASGLVKDETGTILSGVSVSVKNSSLGTSTGDDGLFKLSVPSNSMLVFSMIGFEEIELKAAANMTVTLISKATKSTDNVIVVAYGTTTQKTTTGSLQTIKTEELKDIPVAQVSQKLQGKLAGVQILQTTGRPGDGMSVRIRGQASVSAGNQPLYVVDGFPITGDLSMINPDEIEDISVLKDAASTSLYGSRAANGVVIVTTKRAKSGKTAINVNAYYGLQQIPNKGIPDIMDAREFTVFMREYFQENAVAPGASNYAQWKERSDFYNNIDLNTVGKGTDWYNLITRTAPIQSYTVSLTAGKDKFSSSTVLGFFNQDGVVINTGFKRFNARLNAEYKISDKVKVGANIAPTLSVFSGRPTDGGPFTSGSLIMSAVVASPLAPAVNPDGTMPVIGFSPGMLPTPNWYRVAKEADANTDNNRLLATTYLEAEIIKGLTFKTTVNAELGSRFFRNFVPSTSGNTNQAMPRASGDLTMNTVNYQTWLNENTLTYKKKFGDHSIDVLGGYSAQKYRSDMTNITATNFANDKVRTLSAATTFVPTSEVQEWSITSEFGRLGYSFKNKYLVTASLRRDGSSRFGASKKYGTFSSVSLGWVVTEEDFMQKLDKVSFLKLRASYGTVGNNNIGNYTYYAAVSNINNGQSNNAVFNGTIAPGNNVTTLSNTTLSWERTTQLDIGLDLGLFNNRINFSYDYYNKVTDGLLFNVPVPVYTGFPSLIANIGKFKYWGHEFLVSTRNLVGNFKWSTDFNISFNRNRVEQLGTANAALGGGTSRNITTVGQPIGQLWGYVYEGIYNNADDFAKYPKFQTSAIGSARMKDVNGDGIVTVDDRAIIGNPNPNFIFGITNSFSYKNLDLSIVASGSQGNDIMNTALEYTNNLDGAFNVTKNVANRWRGPDNVGNGLVPTTKAGTTGLYRNANTLWVTDGSHLTIKNITLGYRIPVTNIKYLSSLRAYASVQQAAIFTKYQGSNPEVNTGGDNPLSQGLDQGAYPVPRTFTIGVNVGL